MPRKNDQNHDDLGNRALAFATCEVGGQRKGDELAPPTHRLRATPKTVAWGYYDAKTKPVLRIKSGDTVEVQTLITNSPEGLEKALLPPAQVEQALRDIYKEVTDKGPGGHILTGPIYVEGAEAGDTLEVRIQKIVLALPYSYNGFSRHGAGQGPDAGNEAGGARGDRLPGYEEAAQPGPGVRAGKHGRRSPRHAGGGRHQGRGTRFLLG